MKCITAAAGKVWNRRSGSSLLRPIANSNVGVRHQRLQFLVNDFKPVNEKKNFKWLAFQKGAIPDGGLGGYD